MLEYLDNHDAEALEEQDPVDAAARSCTMYAVLCKHSNIFSECCCCEDDRADKFSHRGLFPVLARMPFKTPQSEISAHV
jgi:hypothetical protein